MRILRNVRLSVRALFIHRVRTSLAVAGAGIGVGGVMVLTAIGEGAREQVLRRIDGLGRNMLVVTAARMAPEAGRRLIGEAYMQELRAADAAAIVRGTSAVIRAAPSQERDMIAKVGAIMNGTTVMGTTADWLAIRQFPLVSGRFFTDAENLERRRVAVLGADARARLFADSVNPIGKTV